MKPVWEMNRLKKLSDTFTISGILIFFLAFSLSYMGACSLREGKDSRPVIIVSILPQKFLVERITGDKFNVIVLVPPGASAETYEPTPRQLENVANSLIYFRIGYMEFERSILRNINQQNTEMVVVDTSEGIDLIAADIVDHGDHVHIFGVDPHIWMSVPAVKKQLGHMLHAIIDADPGNGDYYLENYERFIDELEELHDDFTERFSNLKRRTFLIFHPALGYFARDYNLTQISIEEEGKNPTAANMKKVIDIAREEGLKDVFIQMEFELDNALVIARELGGNVIEINPLAENWIKSMQDLAGKMYEVLTKD